MKIRKSRNLGLKAKSKLKATIRGRGFSFDFQKLRKSMFFVKQIIFHKFKKRTNLIEFVKFDKGGYRYEFE